MPNHVTNEIIIVGTEDDIEFVKQHMKSNKSEFDFNRLVPMPDSLTITSGSAVSNGIAVLLSRQGDHSKIDEIRAYKWEGTQDMNRSEFIEYLLNQRGSSTDLVEAAVALANLKKFGHQDWYSWSIANWGTKWNAYEVRELDNGFRFDTAWSHPAPVIEKLIEFFPEITFKVSFADEDTGYNVGKYTVRGSEIIEENFPEGGSKEAYKLAFEVTGDGVDYFYDMVLNEEEYIDEMLEDGNEYYSLIMGMLVDEEMVDEKFTEAQIKWAINYAAEKEDFKYAEKLTELLTEEIN